MIIRLKGTPIGLYHLPKDGFVQALHKFCVDKKPEVLAHIQGWKDQGRPAVSAHYSSYNLFSMQSSIPLLLLEHLRESVKEFSSELRPDQRPRWIIGWVNYLQPGEVFKMHNHGNSAFFGHLLLEDSGTRNIYLEDGTLEVLTQPGQVTLVGDGRMMHGTTPVPGTKERVSIGFDFFSSEKPLNPRCVPF